MQIYEYLAEKFLNHKHTHKEEMTKDGSFNKKWLKTSKRWLRSEVSIYQHAESIKNVFQAGYRLPGYKIIILRIFNKYSETLNNEYIGRIYQMSS